MRVGSNAFKGGDSAAALYPTRETGRFRSAAALNPLYDGCILNA